MRSPQLTAILALLLIGAHCRVTAAPLPPLRAQGPRLVQAGGKAVALRGVNLAGWLALDDSVIALDSSDGAHDEETIRRVLDDRFGVQTEEALIRGFQQTWIDSRDLDSIHSRGLNAVRVPVSWLLFRTPDHRWRQGAFDCLDWLVGQAATRGIYTIIDLQSVPGGRGLSGKPAPFWTSSADQAETAEIWKAIARHYRGNPAVAFYELLGAPAGAPGKEAVWQEDDRLLKAVRAIDPEHTICIKAQWSAWAAFPQPAQMGWMNVVYEMQQYGKDAQEFKNLMDWQVGEFGRHESWNVPVYLGAFNPLGDDVALWHYVVEAMDDAGISWTVWNYKSAGRDQSRVPLYAARSSLRLPNVQVDSPGAIRSAWGKLGTAEAFAPNFAPMVAIRGRRDAPYGNGGAPPVPGTIQFADYDTGGEHISYHTSTPVHQGAMYRFGGVGIDSCSERDPGNGYDVGWTGPGQWMTYTVNVLAPGSYTIRFRVSAPKEGGVFHLEKPNGYRLTPPVAVPATGGWQNWTDVASACYLQAGRQVLKLCEDTGGYNLEYMSFVPADVDRAESAYAAAPWSVPGVVQFADYDVGGEGVAYHSVAASNQGGHYRNDGVAIEVCDDTTPDGVGYDVGWAEPGQWLAYTVDVRAGGPYFVSLRVAAPTGGRLHLADAAGKDLTGPVSIPATGGWQNWTTVVAPVRLAAGRQVLRLCEDTAGVNYEYAVFSSDRPVDAAPSTRAAVAGRPSTSGAYHRATVVLRAADMRAAPPAIRYTLDGQAERLYTQPIAVSDPGRHVVWYWSVARSGGLEPAHSVVVTVQP